MLKKNGASGTYETILEIYNIHVIGVKDREKYLLR